MIFEKWLKIFIFGVFLMCTSGCLYFLGDVIESNIVRLIGTIFMLAGIITSNIALMYIEDDDDDKKD